MNKEAIQNIIDCVIEHIVVLNDGDEHSLDVEDMDKLEDKIWNIILSCEHRDYKNDDIINGREEII